MQNFSFKALNHKNDLDLVFNILKDAPKFALLSENKLPERSDAELIFSECPENHPHEKKVVMGLVYQQKTIGLLDLLIDYPKSQTTFIGLFLIIEEEQGKGLGTLFIEELKAYLKSHFTVTKLRLAVLDKNSNAKFFWKKVGFQFTGEEKWRESSQQNVLLMELPL